MQMVMQFKMQSLPTGPSGGTPFVVVCKNHGFGGNYSCLGIGGLFHKIAMRSRVTPDYLLVADNTRCWEHYQQVSHATVYGGQYRKERHLYKRVDEVEST